MKLIKIGLCRLYNAKFVHAETNDTITWEHDVHDIHVVCRLSKSFSYSIMEQITLTETRKDEGDKKSVVPFNDNYPANQYFEVFAYKLIEINEELIDSGKQHGLRNEAYRVFKSHERSMAASINYVGGLLGLLISPELVRIQIFELDYKYVFLDNDYYAIQAGLPLDFKQATKINHDGATIKIASSLLKLTSGNAAEKAAECLSWLIRAWSAEDQVLKFISYFTSLECIIPGVEKSDTIEFKTNIKALSSICKAVPNQHPGIQQLIDFIGTFKPSVPLGKRFRRVAELANLGDVDTDVADFIASNKIRNHLLHEGDSSIAQNPYVENEQLNKLEWLAHKYTAFILFGKRKEKIERYKG